MLITGQKKVRIILKTHLVSSWNHTIRLWNTLNAKIQIFSSNLTQVYHFSKDNLIMVKNRDSSLKIYTFSFFFMLTKKKKYCMVIWRKKLNQLELINKKVWLNLLELFCNYFILAYLLHLLSLLSQELLIFVKFKKLMSLKSTETMTL